jgi:uncharacterized membrane protein YdjX (TVP38/TMEM64 family)
MGARKGSKESPSGDDRPRRVRGEEALIEERRAKRIRIAKFVVLGIIYCAPLPLSRIAAVRDGLASGAEWMRDHGAAAIAIYLLAYCLGSLVAAPTMLFNAIAGFAYGPVMGALVAAPSYAIATGFVHVVARRVKFAAPPTGAAKGRFAFLERMLAHADLKTALLLRASPLAPQNLLTLAFPFTGLSATKVMLATLIGAFPLVCVHAYVGSVVANAAELVERGMSALPGPSWTPYAGAVIGVVTIVASIFTLRAAARAAKTDS